MQTVLRSSDQEASPLAANSTGVVLVPCLLCPYSYFGSADISGDLGCHSLRKISSQRGSQKLPQGSVSHEHTAYISDFYFFSESI